MCPLSFVSLAFALIFKPCSNDVRSIGYAIANPLMKSRVLPRLASIKVFSSHHRALTYSNFDGGLQPPRTAI